MHRGRADSQCQYNTINKTSSTQAVLTHKGRSSNSGHYVGWVRHKGEAWLKCDDDEVTDSSSLCQLPDPYLLRFALHAPCSQVSPVHEEDVLKLSGGGDWHTAYLLVYGPRKLPKDRGQSDSTPAAAEGMETS